MTSQPEQITAQAFEAVTALAGQRKLIALAGPPAAGKSTVSTLLRDALRRSGRRAEVIPMDGFHLDNTILEPRELLARKGAPETFDASGFVHLMRRIGNGESVFFPTFDRHRDIAIAGAGYLSEDVEYVLIEGNYLLLDQDPWCELAHLWDYAIWIDAPRESLRARLMQRWLDEGLSESASRLKVDGNDLSNVDFIRAHRTSANLEFSPAH